MCDGIYYILNIVHMSPISDFNLYGTLISNHAMSSFFERRNCTVLHHKMWVQSFLSCSSGSGKCGRMDGRIRPFNSVFFLYFSYKQLHVENNLHVTWYHCTVGHVGHKMAPLCNCTRYKGSCSCSEDELEEPMSHLVSLDSHTSPVRISHKRITFAICQCVAHQPVAESTYNWKRI